MTTLDTLGVRVLDPSPAPGSPEWRRIMTASKVASVIGKGYVSRFTRWHRMAGLIDDEPGNAATREGNIFEPGIRECFREEHPEFIVTEPDGMWVRDDMPWAGATPDGLVFDANVDGPPLALLECKRTSVPWDWGTPGTGEIPEPYICQVQWQMHITGIRRTYVAADICCRMAYYVVDYCAETAQALVAAASEFMDTLPGQPGEQRPDIDADSSTYECVRKLHPDIDPDELVEVGADLAADYFTHKNAVADAKKAEQLAKTRILDLAGNARTITAAGVPVLRRQPAARGAISLVTIKTKTYAKEAA